MAGCSTTQLPPNQDQVVQQLCDLGSLGAFKKHANFITHTVGSKATLHLCGVASKVYTFTFDWEIGDEWPQLFVADVASENKDETDGHRLLNAVKRGDGLAWLSTNGSFYLLRYAEAEDSFSSEMKRIDSLKLIKRQHVLTSCGIQGGLAILCSEDLEWIIDLYIEESKSDEELSHFTTYRMMRSADNLTVDCVPPVVCVGINDVDPNLYKLLFGPDAFLLHSQVIIVGFSDGQVHAIVLKDCSASTVVDKQPILLCSLHQEIKGIYLTGNQKGLPNTVTIIGEHGSVVVLQASVSLPQVVKVVESYIPGPVVAGDFYKKFVYSDSCQIWLSSPACMMGSELLKSTAKRVNLIGGVSLIKLLGTSAGDADAPLALMLTDTGRVLMMKLDILRKDDASICTDGESGQTVSSLLTRISACSLEVMKAKQESEQQKDLIQTLAIASTLLLDDKTCEHFQTSCFVLQDSIICSKESKVKIKIENKGSAKITREYWHVFVSVRLRKSNGTIQHHNASIPLRDDLNPGKSFTALIPISFLTDLSSWDLPCDLVISLQLLVPENYLACKSGFATHSNQENCANSHLCSTASVKLKTFVIDELYILNTPVMKTDRTEFTDLCDTQVVSQHDIWERASAKPSFQDVCDSCPTANTVSRTSISVSPELAKEIAEHFKRTNIQDGLYSFICQNTENVLHPCGIQELKTCCAGFPVTFFVREGDKSVALDIETTESFLTAKVRSAVLRRFMEFKTSSSIEDTVESVAIGPAILAQAQRMRTKVEFLPALQPTGQRQHTLNLYHEIRTGITSKLPLVQNKPS